MSCAGLLEWSVIVMSPPLLGVGEEEGQSNVTLLASSTSLGSICIKGSALKERNYMGLSDCSSVDSCNISTSSEDNNGCGLNLKATELRLGLPGSQSPERGEETCPVISTKVDEKLLFPLHPSKDTAFSVSQKTVVSGNKRGFSDAMDGFSEVNYHFFNKVTHFLVKLQLKLHNLSYRGSFCRIPVWKQVIQRRPHVCNHLKWKMLILRVQFQRGLLLWMMPQTVRAVVPLLQSEYLPTRSKKCDIWIMIVQNV